MKVLMISLDRSVFDPSSPSAARMRAYAEAAGSLTVAVVGLAGRTPVKYGRVRAIAMTPLGLIRSLIRPAGMRCDIVTAQDPFRSGIVGFLLARRTRARLEVQLHGDPWSDPDISRRKISRALWLLRRADGIRIVSERLRERLRNEGLADERVVKIPIGTDRSGEPPRFARPPGFEMVFAYVGRLEKGKGVDLLIDAFAEVRRVHPKIILLIVGDGPERSALEHRARRHLITTDVRFYGWMRDPRGVISAADALVLPSRSEGWGRSPVEALNVGVPVIMTDVGLAGEVVKDGDNGLIVPPGNIVALSEAIRCFAGDGELRARLRRGAAESARALPTFGKTVSDVISAWRGTISRPPAEPPVPERRHPGRRAIVAVFLLALAARLLMFIAINARGGEELFYKYSDGNEYLVVARNLLEGHGFSVRTEPPYLPYSYFSPGYPYLLAGVMASGLGIRFVILIQIVVGAFTAAMLTAFGWRIVGRRAAILSGVLLAVEPSTVFWTNQLVTESFSTIFLIGSFFALASAIRIGGLARYAASGALLAFSTHIRHASQLLVGVFPIAVFIGARGRITRRLGGAALLFFCAVAVLSPWIVRNRMIFGTWSYSTAAGSLGFGKNLRYYAELRQGKDLSELFPDLFIVSRREIGWNHDRIEKEARGLPRAALTVLLSDPIGLAQVYAAGLVPFFFGDGYAQIQTVLGGAGDEARVVWDGRAASLLPLVRERPDALAFLAGKAVWVLVFISMLGGAAGLLLSDPRGRPAVLLALGIIAYYAVGSGVGGYSRFRFPVTPLILFLASPGITSLIGRRGSRLLIVTQTVDLDHPVLGFFHEWIREIAARAPAVEVVALSAGRHVLPGNVSVFAPRSRRKFIRNLSFLALLARRIPGARGVFFHMCPEYAIAAAPLTVLFGTRTLLWYTHRSVTRRLRLAARVIGRIFTAAPESCRIRSPRLEVTGHGIDISPAAPRDPSPDFRILVVGRLAPIKDVGTVIEAAALLRKRGVPATVTVAGVPVYPADEEYAAGLRARVDALGIAPYTRFAGAMKHEDVRAAYRTADVLVNASPNGPDKVVYEAAAAGTLAVAVHPAFRQLFGARVRELYFPEGDAATLADRLAALAALAPEERASLGTELRETVSRDYSLPRLADRIASYFNS